MGEKILVLAGEKYIISQPSHSLFHRIYNLVSKSRMNIIYVLKVIPMVKKLTEDKTKKMIVIGLDAKTQRRFRKNKIKYKIPDDYLTKELYRSIDEDAMTFVRDLPNFEKNSRFKSSCTYQGIFLWELLEVEFWGFFADIIRTFHIVEKIIDKEKPDKIIVTDREGVYGRLVSMLEKSGNFSVSPLVPEIVTNVECNIFKLLMPFVQRSIRKHKRLQPKKINKDIFKKVDKNRILISYYGRFFSLWDSVAKELKKNDKNEISIIGVSDTIGTVKPLEMSQVNFQKGVKQIPFENFMDKEIYKNISNKIKLMEKNWNELKNDSAFKNSITYKNMQLWDLVEFRFLFFFYVRSVKLMEHIELMKKIIDIIKPDIILVEDDRSPLGKTFIEVGKSEKIPTLIVCHGLIADHPIHGPIFADKIAVMGDYMKEALIKRGVSPNQIVITGQPSYDRLLQENSGFGKENICKQLGIDPEKKIIALITQPLPWEINEPVISKVFSSMKNFPEVQLVVKPHPAEESKLHELILRETSQNNIIIKKDLDIFELLFSSEIVITMFSTVGLEAIILDKPVITINLTNKPDSYPYAESGAALGVYKPEDISNAIKKVLYDPEVGMALKKCRKKFVYEHAYKMDGLASRRVADLIEGMMEGK